MLHGRSAHGRATAHVLHVLRMEARPCFFGDKSQKDNAVTVSIKRTQSIAAAPINLPIYVSWKIIWMLIISGSSVIILSLVMVK